MRVVVLVPDNSFRALQRALRARDVIERAHDVGSLARRVSGDVDAVVIDPSILSDTEWARARQMLESPDLPVLLYAALDASNVRRIVAASGIGVHEVMLRAIDDDPAAIRRRLDTLRSPAPPTRVLSAIAGRIAQLPTLLQSATVPLFCAGKVPRWADGLVAIAQLPRRSVDRWFGSAGLAGTASLLDVARLARAWVPIVEQKLTPTEVAIRAGFGRSRMLAVHARRIVGVSPMHFAVKLNADEFVARLTRYATRG